MNRFDIALNKKSFKFLKSCNKKDRTESNLLNRTLDKLSGIVGHGLSSPQRNITSMGISGDTGTEFGDTGTEFGETSMGFGETGIQPAGFWSGSTGVWFSDTGIQPAESMRHGGPPVFSLEREFEEQAREEEQAFNEVAETMVNMGTLSGEVFGDFPIELNPAYPSAVIHSGDSLSTRGPTSRHLMIAGPDGHRVIIPLRTLDFSINGNTLAIRLPDGQASALQSDIQAGIRRQEEVDNNRHG